jgi:site-specific DNA-methyltransferase (adenine-specific)
LFHFVKDENNFTFNGEEPQVRVPSARALVYADKRANPAGRLPDDTWILRPQDLPAGFQPADDTWYFARVAGTFKERQGFHGCQMPEQLLGRIIRVSSNPGDIVLDPFAGSGTTLAGQEARPAMIGCESRKKTALPPSGCACEQALADGPADPIACEHLKWPRWKSEPRANGSPVFRPVGCGIDKAEEGNAKRELRDLSATRLSKRSFLAS